MDRNGCVVALVGQKKISGVRDNRLALIFLRQQQVFVPVEIFASLACMLHRIMSPLTQHAQYWMCSEPPP